MLALWLLAGAGYYQLLRHPRAVAAATQWLQRPAPAHIGDDLGSEQRSISEFERS
jgi:hypothetical protein